MLDIILAPLYNLGMYAFALVMRVAACFNPKIKKMVEGQRQTWKLLQQRIKKDDEVAWFHAASLGEFEQGRPIMELLRAKRPEVKILLTFFSPSGYEVRKNYEGADVVCYLPFDTRSNAKHFVRLAHPSQALFIKYEFWSNFLSQSRKHGTKVYSVSSIFRPKQRFFKWWWTPVALRQFNHFFVQNEESKTLLNSIGLNNCTVTGDTRFDRVVSIRNAAKPLPLIEKFAQNEFVFVAGSSWEEDEARYLPYFEQNEKWKLIIAPHVISEAHLHSIIGLLGKRKWVRYSELEKGESHLTPEVSVVIVDCFGLLSSIYRYATVALVGGGFGAGIHNVTEAAVYSIPVIFGPNNQKFREAQGLLRCGGGKQYKSATEFAAEMDAFESNPEYLKECSLHAGEYISEHTGAAERCYNAIFSTAGTK